MSTVPPKPPVRATTALGRPRKVDPKTCRHEASGTFSYGQFYCHLCGTQVKLLDLYYDLKDDLRAIRAFLEQPK